jgi:hypothetical protein
MKKIAVLGMFVGAAGLLSAQETHRFAFSAGAGFSTPVIETDHAVDYGWRVGLGAGVNFNHWAGLMLNAGFDSMGIKHYQLQNLGYGGGNLNVLSFTLDPVVHVTPRGPVDLYFTGGGGLFRQQQQFTQPGVATGTAFDPFFGFYPVNYGTNIVVSDYSVNKPGIDGGMGIAFGRKWGGKFYGEAKYTRIFSGAYHTDYIPVTFGFRW